MKKIFFFLTCALLATFFASHAQLKPTALSGEMTHSDEHLAKKAIDLLIMKKFREKSPHVSNDQWAKTENGYLVSYTSDGILYNTFLNKKGKLTSQIRYYSEKDLPSDVRYRVKGLNGCFTISSVKEITTKNSTAYLVTISDENSWRVIRVFEDEMGVIEEYQKG